MGLDIFENPVLIYSILIVGGVLNFISLPSGISNIVKKVLGAVWIVTAVYATYSLFSEGFKKMGAANATTQTSIQWWIILIIFSIVMVGFAIHGYYGVTGEYDEASEK